MRYYLADSDRRWMEQRACCSILAGDMRPGYFRLFNKNGLQTLYVRPVGQIENAMVWIVEADEVPAYFNGVLKAEAPYV